MPQNSNYLKRAYSLAEMAIVLAILGMLAGTFFDVKKFTTEAVNIKNINDQMQQIEEAIDTYIAKNGFLPCPARRTDLVDTANFGKATDCFAAAPSGTIETGTGVDTIRIGVLPVRNLDLPDSMMFDPWNNRITYVVVKDLAKNSSSYDSFTTTATDVIRVNSANGNRIHRSNLSTMESIVSWVAVSHGKDGRGAYNYNGILKTCSAALDQENCDDDNIFIDTAYNPSSANPFDDYIRWKTRIQQAYDKQSVITPGSNSNPQQCPAGYDPSTFSPKDVNGIRLWLDASDFTTMFEDESCTDTTDGYGDRVRCWKDKSDNGYKATQSSGGDSPTWYNDGGKGHVCFEDKFLRILGSPNGAVFPNGSTLSGIEFFMVHETTNSGKPGRTFSYPAGNGVIWRVPDSSMNIDFQFNNSFSGNKFAFSSYNTQIKYLWHCSASTTGGTEFKCWNNDKLVMSTSNAGPAITIGTQNFFIGCDSANKTWCQYMHLYEFIIYDRKLTDEERSKIKTYLYKRWW
jgi:type II secretory pathway pseudopilin PulG